MQIKDYVKPELLVVALVLYFIGMWLKQSETVKDKYIPLINDGIGVLILRDLCLRHLRVFQWSGYCSGCVYGTDAGRSCSRIIHLRKSAFKTIK